MYKMNLSKQGLCLLFILVITIFLSAGCALTHKIYYGSMRKGYIDEVNDSGVIVVHGKKTGVQVGEEFDAYEVIIEQRAKYKPPFQKSIYIYKGRIRITKIIDDYHSMAIIISGQVKENYKCVQRKNCSMPTKKRPDLDS